MWNATYIDIDKNGFRADIKVTVEFANDQDETVYRLEYFIPPEDLNSEAFQTRIKNQIEILNAKDQIDTRNLVSQKIETINPVI